MQQILANDRMLRTPPCGGVLSGICLDVAAAAVQETSVVEAVYKEIVGTKQTRRGAMPDPAAAARIKWVIGLYVERGLPIPFMVPWGSEKPDGTIPDCAEYGAVKTMTCLNARVKAHYEAGVVCNIRAEDVSAPHLFFDRADDARREAQRYTNALKALVRVIGDGSVAVRAESSMTSEAVFNTAADEILPLMERHIKDPDDVAVLGVLAELGWKGTVSSETRHEFMVRYRKLYPLKDDAWRLHVVARYFSGVLARKRLGLRGDDPTWEGKFLDLSFVEPSRLNDGIFPTRVYYRTVPLSQTSDHLPPWRAKGYLQMAETGCRARLANFGALPSLHENEVTLVNASGDAATIRCDWCQ